METKYYVNGEIHTIPERADFNRRQDFRQKFVDEGLTKPEKYLRIMPDYYATGVWNFDGINCRYSKFPLSAYTVSLIEVWVEWYNWQDSVTDEFRKCTEEQFLTLGNLIFERAMAELPDYTIEYFPE